jgi:hypothetical protein
MKAERGTLFILPPSSFRLPEAILLVFDRIG